MEKNKKKILITGKNSYIGQSFFNYCQRIESTFDITELDVHGTQWKGEDFSKYDAILNVAGIAHRKETSENRQLYYEVNRDLAVEIATKAKEEGVSHYLYLSTMNVYGLTEGLITEETECKPKTAYGISKLEAENIIINMSNATFKVGILRPPMVYGPNTVGNYVKLSKFAKKTKVFPDINNQRSMIFVDNLSEFIVNAINSSMTGIMFPQNAEYVSTKEMIKIISEINENNIYFVPLFNKIIKNSKTSLLKKVFGDLIYDKQLSIYDFNYQTVNFRKSLEVAENG